MTNEYFFGVDLGGTNVEMGLLDEEGTIVAHVAEPTNAQEGPQSLVERVAEACCGLAKQAQVPPDKIRALGIGSPGPMSMSQGKLINLGNLPGFKNFFLRAELSRRLEVPALLENDANSACWGEFWLGAGRDVNDMVLFTLGTGIGGGIVIGGELIHGSDENAGELGHMIIQTDGRQCTCGQNGCVEAYASATATAARAMEVLDEGRKSELVDLRRKNGTLTCKDVFDYAETGDSLANEIVNGTAQALAQICVSMRHITEPEMVVLTGGMIKAGDILINRVRSFYEEMVWKLKPEPMDICFAELGGHAGFIGAAGLAVHAYKHHQQRLYPSGT
jgi:glucokinase